MKISRLRLTNFRGFRKADIEFQNKSAVFFGVNGVGKTTILRAIDLIYANFIGSVLQTRKRLAELNEDDIYDNSTYAKAEIEYSFGNDEKYEYRRQIYRGGKRTHNKSVMDDIVDSFSKKYLGGVEINQDGEEFFNEKHAFMPIFVNYGVNRLVLETPLDKDNLSYEKINAFDNAIESKIDFKGFFSWFKREEDLENEMIARVKKEYPKQTAVSLNLDAVRNAMLSMFPGFKNARVDRKLNTLVFEKEGETLNINQLSDGEKCTIALFGDIARRMAIANNGFLKDPLSGNGVVLIDEVDLHLHPAWQRKIVGILRKTFPNIQFILTTHSPQVLGGVDPEMSIFSINKTETGNEIYRQESLYGWDTNIILEEVMGTSRVNDEVRLHMEKMYQAYDNGEYEAASREADWIDIKTSGHNDCVAGMRVMISRKKRKLLNEKNQ